MLNAGYSNVIPKKQCQNATHFGFENLSDIYAI